MRYFFDNNLAPTIAEALKALGQDTIHMADCEEHGIRRDDEDVAWMPRVAQLGWTAVTIDSHIRRRQEERRVRQACGLRVVYLYGSFGRKLRGFQQAVFLLRAWEEIVRVTAGAKPGQCFEVTEGLRVRPLP